MDDRLCTKTETYEERAKISSKTKQDLQTTNMESVFDRLELRIPLLRHEKYDH